MKKIIIISATLKNNYKLAKDIKDILKDMNVDASLISLEDYILPLYTDKIFSEKKDSYYKKLST